MEPREIDLTPTWETAVFICCEVLKDPEARQDGKVSAQAELMRLAREFDKLQGKTVTK